MNRSIFCAGVLLIVSLYRCAFCSIDFEQAIANDVYRSAILDQKFDADADCSDWLAKLSADVHEISQEMPRCLAYARGQILEANETPQQRYERLQSEYPVNIDKLVHRAIQHGEMDDSCYDYQHYPTMFAKCREDAKNKYLARVSDPGFVPLSCSQYAIHRKMDARYRKISSMDYEPLMGVHLAFFLGSITRRRGNELVVDFGGREAVVAVTKKTRFYRKSSLVVGSEVYGFGIARKGGFTILRRNRATGTIAIIDAECIQ